MFFTLLGIGSFAGLLGIASLFLAVVLYLTGAKLYAKILLIAAAVSVLTSIVFLGPLIVKWGFGIFVA